MFVNQGIQPVTVVFSNTKDCFIHLPSKLISHLSLNEKHAVELSWDHGCPPVFLGWTRNPSSSGEDDHKVALCRYLGQKLGLKDGEQGYLRPCHQVSSVHQVFVEPVSSDDWEILELHSSALEQQLLDQIRVVFQDAVFPVWVDQRTVIYIRIASLSPSVPYGRLEQFTELMVSPKIRAGTSGIHHTTTTTTTGHPLPTTQGSQQPPPPPHHRHRSNLDLPSSAAPSATSFQTSAHQGHGSSSNTSISASSSWGGGGIADLKSLVRYMLTGSYDDRAADHPVSVPTIPALVSDSMYRVCRAPPGYACTISPHGGGAAAGVVHLFPWWRGTEDGTPGGRSAVTYGLLSRVLSPKEGRERVKRSVEKKKKVAGTGSASSKDPTGAAPGAGRVGEEQQRQEEVEEEEETMVVRVVCHHMEQLAGGLQRYPDMGEIHCGRVWMPEHLTTQLNISPHSMVRIKPVQTTCKVASSIRLQPLKPASQPDENDEDIQTAFLDWLHAQSHQPLACLTARHSVIPLHGHEAKLELALTVLKPEPENDHPDQLFLLSPTLLRKPVIQVDRQPVNTPAAVKSQGDTLHPDLPCTSALGGVKDLITTGFEFIYYSLQAGPLSRELVSTGRGLRGGALLITGAKGSGKSSLAKALCRRAGEDLDAHVEVVDCKKLKGKRVETVRQRLEEVFEQAVWRQPSVVLLDDLDHVTGAPTSPEHEHGPEAILRKHIAQSLIDIVGELVQRSSLVCLLLSSHSEHSLHASLTQVQGSHFIQGFLHIQPPDQTQRAEILRCLMLQRTGLSEETLHTLDLGMVAKETEGYAPRDLALLLERSVHASVVRTGHTEHGVCVSQEDFHAALKGFTAPSLLAMDLHTPPSGVGLDRVGGLKEVRRQLMDAILLPAKYPILFSKLPIRHCSGLLLYGAPGTGKTLLAGAVAKESGMNFISIKGPELLSKYIGASEQAVRDVFQRAQAARPCILFFDEFDSLAPRRGHDSTGVTDRVVNQLLTQLDGVEGLQGVYVLAASSRPDLIDPALLRPGRLDKSLYCPPPDLEDRVEILKALSSGLPLADDVDLEQLAAATELFTGADLRALLYNGQLEAAHCSLAASTNTHELASGSDSDMSLGSMIFLNHSSGSDDSAGEAEPVAGPDQAAVAAMAVLPENQQRPPLEAELHRSNLWRLYFGSSYESELGNNNASLSGQNSQCVSGPNSMSQDLAGLSVRLPPAYMPSVQRGFEEPNQEQMERLLQEIRTIKSNLRRANGRQDSGQQETPVSSGSGLLLTQSHLTSALQTTRASLSKADWNKYCRLYEAFGATGESTVQTSVPFQAGQRVTLA